MTSRICLIEDDPIMGEALLERLTLEGYVCDWWQSGAAALDALRKRHYAVVLCDIRLPDMSGEVLYARLCSEASERPPFLFITAHGAIDQAVRLLKLGAEDYLTKPLEIPLLLAKVRELAERMQPATADADELGISQPMRRIAALLPLLAQHADTVLITGESGVGKEWVARALHRHFDPEGRKAFVAVNCGALSEGLLESELFGHVRGAFTGAVRDKPGVFEQAHGGTLFLDEVGDMSPLMQVKLLRVIQERQVTRVGGERAIPVSVKIICATHRDLAEMVRRGDFREDLYYRIHAMHVHVPPLRERPEDILWLAQHILGELSEAKGLEPFELDPLTQQILTTHPWPGNIRELRHALERACILGARLPLSADVLFGSLTPDPACADKQESTERLDDFLARCEAAHIRRMLSRHGWRITQTAAELGISRKALWEKMRRLGIGRDDE